MGEATLWSRRHHLATRPTPTLGSPGEEVLEKERINQVLLQIPAAEPVPRGKAQHSLTAAAVMPVAAVMLVTAALAAASAHRARR